MSEKKDLKFKVLLLDWNGTCLNDLELSWKSVENIFEIFNLPAPTIEQFKKEITNDFMKFYHNHGIPTHIKAGDLNKIREAFFFRPENKIELRTEVMPLLNACQKLGIRLGMVSGECPEILDRRLKEFGIQDRFEFVKAGVKVKDEALKDALKFFGIEPKEAVYVDDSFDGTTSAKNVGIFAVAYPYGCSDHQLVLSAKADRNIKSLLEVIEILES